VLASRRGVNLLGAVTEYGETTVLESGRSFTGEVTIRFLEHLQAQFGEKLVMLLDQATYFTASVTATLELLTRFVRRSGQPSKELIGWGCISVSVSEYKVFPVTLIVMFDIHRSPHVVHDGIQKEYTYTHI